MVFVKFYRLLLIAAVALFVLSGCSQTQWPAYPGYSANGSNTYPWYWDPSCNCWVNVSLQNQPAAAPVAVTTPCTGACNPTPALVPCSDANPCSQPATAKPRLRLLQANVESSTALPLPPAPATLPAITANAAVNSTTPSYWDPNCQCWVTARYLTTTPAAPASAITTANEAKVMAAQALKASGETDEKLNRMYQRLIQK